MDTEDADNRDPAERRNLEKRWMVVETRGKVPEAAEVTTRDMIDVGVAIGAIGLIVQFGDDDGYEHFCATHWLPPDDPDRSP